tara:strand:+ start:54 stop:1229 length:1176 start_codon:yes stop_codon:yes gene_type:complete
MAPWLIPAAIGAGKAALGVFGASQRRGAAQKAGRDANKARVARGKKAVRASWRAIAQNYKDAVDSLDILQRNTERQLDLADLESLRNWGMQEELRFDDYRRDAAAYNQSVEDYHTALNFNDIAANMAYQEEQNFMEDFFTQREFEKKDETLEHEKILRSDIASRFSLRRQQEGFRAKTAFDDQQDIIQGLKITGQLRATGTVGRSARKAVQAASMDLGTRQAMRMDALMNSESMYYNEMTKLSNTRYLAKKARNLNIDKRAASLKSMLKANTLRKDRIAADKFSADLQAQSRVLPEPVLREMTPIPFEAFRPEFQQPTKPNQGQFYKDHMPELEDENKIYGDRGAGAPGNAWLDAGNIILGGVQGYMDAGGDFGLKKVNTKGIPRNPELGA